MANNMEASASIYKTKLTANDVAAQEPLWTIRTEYDSTNWVRKFKYVQNHSDSTIANWSVAWYLAPATDATWSIVSWIAATTSLNWVAWVWIWAITASYYWWIQIWWYHSAIITNGDDDIAAWDALIWSSTNYWCNSTAANTAPTNKVLGWAVAVDSDANNTVAWKITVWE